MVNDVTLTFSVGCPTQVVLKLVLTKQIELMTRNTIFSITFDSFLPSHQKTILDGKLAK
jgi:hypothetical protein